MAIRMNNLENFKGDKYITQPELKEAVDNAISGSSGLIGEDGNLKPEYNPITIDSIGKGNVGKKDQDFKNLKFIGNCKVTYNDGGEIVIRIGENLNCSLFNGTDGISTTKVSNSISNAGNKALSSNYTSAVKSAAGSFTVINKSAKYSVSCGPNPTNPGGGNSENGNEVHFEDNENGSFKFYISSGVGYATKGTYELGKVTGDKGYKGGNQDSITLTVSNFGTEPKTVEGATGYSGNVSFSFDPSLEFTESTNFKIDKVEQLENGAVVATWNGDSTGYFYMKDADRGIKPEDPTEVDYDVVPQYMYVSGVKYMTTASTVTPKASNIKNLAYPVNEGGKVTFSSTDKDGKTWFDGSDDSTPGHFTTWNTEKGKAMKWAGSPVSLKAGKYTNPEIKVSATNFNGASKTVSSTGHSVSYLVCDKSSGLISGEGPMREAGRLGSDFTASFNSETSLTAEKNTDLQIYNGYIQYPAGDFTPYGGANYDTCSGDRFYYYKFTGKGTVMTGQINVTCDSNPQTHFANSNMTIEISKSPTTDWMDIGVDKNQEPKREDKIPYIGAGFTWDTTSSIKFGVPQESLYPQGDVYVRIRMKKNCSVKVSNVEMI